jgi:hypothetical protein
MIFKIPLIIPTICPKTDSKIHKIVYIGLMFVSNLLEGNLLTPSALTMSLIPINPLAHFGLFAFYQYIV